MDPQHTGQPSHTSQPFRTIRFGCPVCLERFSSLKEKKAHVRAEHKQKEAPRAK